MNWNWNEVGLWFVTAFVGAGIVKLIDLVASRYADRQSRLERKVSVLLDHIKEFGQLAELYRFYASYSARKVMDEKGQLQRDDSGNFVVEKRILEPEPRFEAAIKNLQGTDISAAIAQKIASIRLSSSEAMDIANELDRSGGLKQQFVDTVACLPGV